MPLTRLPPCAKRAWSEQSGVAASASGTIERCQIDPASRGLMSDYSTTVQPPTQAETPEAFLADRQRFWNGFTHFTLGVVICLIILLVGMAIFLL